MLHLMRHLTEDELLALRERRDDDPARRAHLEECPRCQRRFTFLRAFKAALKKSATPRPPWTEPGGAEEEEAPSSFLLAEAMPAMSLRESPPGPYSRRHPDPATIAAYVDGALPEHERAEVRRHLATCERCMADLLVLFPGEPATGAEETRAAREFFRRHGVAIRYGTSAEREGRPQLVVRLVDGTGREVTFDVLESLPPASGTTAPSLAGERRLEVMVGTGRVTVTARRERGLRYLDVRPRELGRPGRRPVTIALEAAGRPVASVTAGRPSLASLLVPDLPEFDLRVDGGWEIPVVLRFIA